MWVYKLTENTSDVPVFTVGHYDPEGKWEPDSDWPDRDMAGDRCNYLNGGPVTGL